MGVSHLEKGRHGFGERQGQTMHQGVERRDCQNQSARRSDGYRRDPGASRSDVARDGIRGRMEKDASSFRAIGSTDAMVHALSLGIAVERSLPSTGTVAADGLGRTDEERMHRLASQGSGSKQVCREVEKEIKCVFLRFVPSVPSHAEGTVLVVGPPSERVSCASPSSIPRIRASRGNPAPIERKKDLTRFLPTRSPHDARASNRNPKRSVVSFRVEDLPS